MHADEVHTESKVDDLVTVVVSLASAGFARRIDEPAPANCPRSSQRLNECSASTERRGNGSVGNRRPPPDGRRPARESYEAGSGLMIPKVAPCGSRRTQIRPTLGTSIGSISAAPPSSFALAVAASGSSTATY